MPDDQGDFARFEQIRVDNVQTTLEDARVRLEEALDRPDLGGADRRTDAQIRTQYREQIADIDRWLTGSTPFLLGRVVAENGNEHFIGRRHGFSDPVSGDVLVVSSSLNNLFSEGFFQATPENPMGVAVVVRYIWRSGDPWQLERCRVTNISGIDLGIAEVVEPTPIEALEEIADSLTRDGALQDVLATFQADQDRLVREPLPGILIIQGGPGTGKTVVGVERAAWAEVESHTGRVLFVAPTRTFFEYTRPLVAGLGARRIDQRLLRDCGLGDIRVSREDLTRVARVKGSAAMLDLLQTAVDRRVRARDIVLPLAETGSSVSVPEAEVQLLIDQVRAGTLKHNPAGQDFRLRLVARAGKIAEAEGAITATDFAARLDRGALGRALGAVWPRLRPEEMLNRLYADATALQSARGESMSSDDARMLHVPEPHDEYAWSEHDVPLLDELRHMLDNDVDMTYDHVVVDEAQDLTPMQVRMLARRARRSSMTLLGDLAQATGPIDVRSWQVPLEALEPTVREAARVRSLSRGFRVPKQFMALAEQSLDYIDPDRSLPRVEAILEGVEPPEVRSIQGSQMVPALIEAAQESIERFGRVAVVGTTSRLAQLEVGLEQAGVRFVARTADGTDGLILRTPEEIKGIEYDSVIVVEAREIALSSDQGAQLLYVALTRAASRLLLLHSKGLPPELGGEPLRLPTPETFDYGDGAIEPDAHGEQYGDRLADAFVFARRVYANRARRKSRDPHLPHALEVASLVMGDGASEDEVIAALLHDAFEHQNWEQYLTEVQRDFGRPVAEMVTACSWHAQGANEPWIEWKSEYLQAFAAHDGPHKEAVYRITLAEKLANARDFLDDADLTSGTLWTRTSDNPEDVVRYYRKLADIFRGSSSEPLSREFDRVLDDLDDAVLRLAAGSENVDSAEPQDTGLGPGSSLSEDD